MNFSDDFVWNAILRHLPGRARARRAATHFNCPMCVRRGETPDRRMRCAAYHDAEGIGLHCYNCGFKSRYAVGERLSAPFREFLDALGVPDDEVKRVAFRAASIEHVVAHEARRRGDGGGATALPRPRNTVEMPRGARPIRDLAEEGCENPDFVAACAYLLSRGEAVQGAVDYHWSPSPDLRHRLLIPFREAGRLVGWTGRATRPGVSPKYHSHAPPGFLFNNDALRREDRRFVVVVEGVFDALALDGVGVLGADMNEAVIAQIKASRLSPVVLPDHDKAGQRLIDHALAHGWAVAFPALRDGRGHDDWWAPDVKDAADAARLYGRLYALRSVLRSATSTPLKIEANRKLL